MIHADVLGERARVLPEKLALVVLATGERLTYGMLDARVARCAAFLRDGLGIRKGERVGLLCHNRVEFLEVFLAAAKAGFVAVPFGTRLTAHEVAYMAKDAELAAFVYDGALAETVQGLRPLVSVPRWIALDEPLAAGDLRYAEGVARADAAAFARTPCEPEDLLALLYTSGTTGKPKGVMVPHRMAAFNAVDTAVSWQLRDDDVSLVYTPLYHAGGLGAFLLPIFAIGGTIVLHSGFDPEEVWRTVANERATVMLGVPTIWKMLLESPAFATADTSSIRWLASGGAPLPLYLIDAFAERGLELRQGYGLTEVGVNCFAMTPGKKGTIGRPIMFTEAKLVDEAGREVPADEVGELCLRGPHVCAGYWRNPEATAAALDAEGWFHTGDLARRDTEGRHTIAGRRKDMLISGGVNVYPAEIEGELLLHPAVEDAAVVGVPHPTWGEVGVAFVVARGALGAEELLAFAATKLAKFKLPKEVVFLEALPRTPYGKVVKGELRERWVKEHGA